MTRPAIQVGILFFVWAACVAFVPAGVYWRDAPEFVLVAQYLDVAHPAGFPLYGQLANFFAALPLGPVTWRVNAFSTFTAIVVLALSSFLVWRILGLCFSLGSGVRVLLSLLPSFTVLQSPGFIRQALTAEVYLLNATIVLMLLHLYLQFRVRADNRVLVYAAFLLGLGLGNHVSLALPALLVLLVLLRDWRRVKVVIAPAIVLFCFGFAVYGYLPVRARANPPLNTGAVVTADRLLGLMTNQRDRDLRVSVAVSTGSTSSNWALPVVGWARDLRRLGAEVGFGVAFAAVIGFVGLCLRELRVAWVLGSVLVGTLVFFAGWDSDAWISALVMAAVFGAIGLGEVAQRSPRRLASGLVFGLVVITAVAVVSDRGALVRQIGKDSAAGAAAAAVLSPVERNAAYFIEGSWFLARHAQLAEGTRDDIALLYQPAVLFPRHFGPVALQVGAEKFQGEWDTSSLTALINFLGQYQKKICFEPSAAFNSRFAQIARLTADGQSCFERGQPGALDPLFVTTQVSDKKNLSRRIADEVPELRADAQQYLELVSTNVSALLSSREEFTQAGQILEAVCAPLETTRCSPVALNNWAVFLMRSGRPEAAESILRAALRRYPAASAALTENLKISTRQQNVVSTEAGFVD